MVQPSIQQFYPRQVPRTPPRKVKTHDVESMDEITVLESPVLHATSEEMVLEEGLDICDLGPGESIGSFLSLLSANTMNQAQFG